MNSQLPADVLFQKQVLLHVRSDSSPSNLSNANSNNNNNALTTKQWVTVTVAMASKTGSPMNVSGNALSQNAQFNAAATTSTTTMTSPAMANPLLNQNNPTSNNQSSSTARWKVLQITLTDESDPFFLFQLEIGEEDFHQLKSEQNLLVDFSEFPYKFVELLEECIHAVKGGRYVSGRAVYLIILEFLR